MTQPARGGKRNPVVVSKIHNRQATDLLRNAQVAPVVVDDPFAPGEKIAVVRSIRDDILAEMLARKEIDQAQYDAGRKYEQYAEQAEIGNVQAIDPSKEAVDGGRGYEGITDAQIDAVRQLSEAARVLGQSADSLVHAVLVRRMRFNRIADTRVRINALRVRFFAHLERLAEHWGSTRRQVSRDNLIGSGRVTDTK